MNDTLTDLSSRIAATVTQILQTDAELVSGYSTVKARATARYTILIGEAYAAGELTDEDLAAEVEELDRMAERFVRNLRALAHTAVERVFLAVAQTLRGALGAPALAQGVAPPELRLPQL